MTRALLSRLCPLFSPRGRTGSPSPGAPPSDPRHLSWSERQSPSRGEVAAEPSECPLCLFCTPAAVEMDTVATNQNILLGGR